MINLAVLLVILCYFCVIPCVDDGCFCLADDVVGIWVDSTPVQQHLVLGYHHGDAAPWRHTAHTIME